MSDDDAEAKPRFDPGAIEIGARPERGSVEEVVRADKRADKKAAAAASGGSRGNGNAQRTVGLALVVLAGVALFAGGALIYSAAQRLPSRLPPPQLAQVIDAARGYLRVAAYAMMGGGFAALLGWRMLVAARRKDKERARG